MNDFDFDGIMLRFERWCPRCRRDENPNAYCCMSCKWYHPSADSRQKHRLIDMVVIPTAMALVMKTFLQFVKGGTAG